MVILASVGDRSASRKAAVLSCFVEVKLVGVCMLLLLRFRRDTSVVVQHAGLGAKVGMQKQNLLQLKAVGETWQAQGLAPAPHMLGPDGKVSVPSKWGNMLRSKAAAETTQTQKTDSV
jgi:hypothetical protein